MGKLNWCEDAISAQSNMACGPDDSFNGFDFTFENIQTANPIEISRGSSERSMVAVYQTKQNEKSR